MTPFIFRIDENGHLSTSTVEQREGIDGLVDADAALARIIPPEGIDWAALLREYRKATGLNEKKGKEALKERMNGNPKTLDKDKETGLFVLVEPVPRSPFDKQEDKPCPF